jgi:hypothetical protein
MKRCFPLLIFILLAYAITWQPGKLFTNQDLKDGILKCYKENTLNYFRLIFFYETNLLIIQANLL